MLALVLRPSCVCQSAPLEDEGEIPLKSASKGDKGDLKSLIFEQKKKTTQKEVDISNLVHPS